MKSKPNLKENIEKAAAELSISIRADDVAKCVDIIQLLNAFEVRGTIIEIDSPPVNRLAIAISIEDFENFKLFLAETLIKKADK